ncbi:MAG: SGNH/GDSL hydrolase family protein, partial [Bdellovibrionales bacterium]|nr:SGNH/GDSL hydrolase family protein [Bdellovibrionales bacterium]
VSLALAFIGAQFIVSSPRPKDLEVVQLKTQQPPFFEGVFRTEDYLSKEVILKDPITNVRGKPLIPAISNVGPHDILGFRNLAVPRTTDVVVLGDSQTYGINVSLDQNWPTIFSRFTHLKVYSMAFGGWAAPQYISLIEKALALQPKIVVLAIYLGNDALESFRTVYTHEYWKLLRQTSLKIEDAPEMLFPPPADTQISLPISSDREFVFTPTLRMKSLDVHDAVIAEGFRIILQSMQEIAQKVHATKRQLIIAVIPVKESVYRERIFHAIPSNEIPKSLSDLWNAEEHWRKYLESASHNLPATSFIDLTPALQGCAERDPYTYPPDHDGHPLEEGYKCIAQEITRVLTVKTGHIEN